jgi:flagellar hook-associated protein 3 FlgL
MTMRVSTSMVYRLGAETIGRQQSEWLRTQQQLSTGRRMLTPSDDPLAAAQALRTAQSRALAGQWETNQGAAREKLALAESTLGAAGDAIQDARVLLVQANSPTLADADRASLALELGNRLERLLAIANTRDANGDYLFSGYQGATQPFAATAAGAAYNGDEGERLLQVAGARTIAVSASGAAIFDRVPDGNGVFAVTPGAANAGSATHDGGAVSNAALLTGDRYRIQFSVSGTATTYDVIDLTTASTVASGAAYADGQAIQFDGISLRVRGAPADGDRFDIDPSGAQSVFTTLRELVSLLETPVAANDAARAALVNGVTSGLQSLDQALERVLEARARMGAHLAELESLGALVSAGKVHDEAELARLTELDYAEAASRFAAQQTALEAAQRSYLRVTGLSLFEFI